MTDPTKRVFISYRRSVTQHLSLLLFKELRARGFDVFRDYSSVGPGDFERIIPNQISTRDHFILLLTPGTLDRCNYDEKSENPKAPNPEDWLRKEVEQALKTERNIVPLLVDDYQWTMVMPKLTAGIGNLRKCSPFRLSTEHDGIFDASMKILCEQFLVKSANAPTAEPTPEEAQEAQAIIEASEAERVDEKALEAERLFAEGFIASQNKDHEQALKLYNEAISLRPGWVAPYNNRGLTYYSLGQIDKALQDFNKADECNPNDPIVLTNRGNTYEAVQIYENALSDYNRAISINPQYASAYHNRGVVYYRLKQVEEALSDYDRQYRWTLNILVHMKIVVGSFRTLV